MDGGAIEVAVGGVDSEGQHIFELSFMQTYEEVVKHNY